MQDENFNENYLRFDHKIPEIKSVYRTNSNSIDYTKEK